MRYSLYFLLLLSGWHCKSTSKNAPPPASRTQETLGAANTGDQVFLTVPLSTEALGIADRLLQEQALENPDDCLILVVEGAAITGVRNATVELFVNAPPEAIAEGRKSPFFVGMFTYDALRQDQEEFIYNIDLAPRLKRRPEIFAPAVREGAFDVTLKASPFYDSVEAALPQLTIGALKLRTHCP